MSHIVTVKTQVLDAAAVHAACQRLRLPQPVQGTHRLFTNQATGLAVQLPKWRIPSSAMSAPASSTTTTSRGIGASRNSSMRSCRATPSRRRRSKPAARAMS